VNPKERVVKAGKDSEEALAQLQRAKRLKTERDHELQLIPNELAPNPPDLGAGSSGVEEMEGVPEDHLRSHHADFVTLATDPQLPNVDHITADILFSNHHFHDPGQPTSTLFSQHGDSSCLSI